MFKRVSMIVMAVVMMVSLNSSVFVSGASYASNSIEIISPQIGSEGDVVLKKKEMYVNLCNRTKGTVYMSLYKVTPDSNILEDPMQGETLPLGDYYRLSNVQKKEVEKSLSARYNKTSIGYAKAKKTYFNAVITVKKVFGDVSKMEKMKNMSPYQRQVADQYKRSSADYSRLKSEFSTIASQYERLFSTRVFGVAEIKPSNVIPYYKVIIPNVTRGNYKMVFTQGKDGSGVVKTVRFNATTSADAVDEIIKTIPDSMNEIWSVPIE